MIFTSIAAALLAAVTGMTTVRVPGGEEQQVEVKPACACELTVAEIADPFEMMNALHDFGNDSFFGKSRPGHSFGGDPAVEFAFNLYHEMRDLNFVPATVSYYNVYSVEEVRPTPRRPLVYKESLEYTIVSFADKGGFETVTYITGNPQIMDDVEPEDGMIIIPAFPRMDKTSVKYLSDVFSNAGLEKVNFAKFYYGDETLQQDDCIYLDTDPIEVIDFLELMIGGIHPTGDGGSDDGWNNWAIWYEELKRLQKLMVVGGIEDGVEPTVWLGDELIMGSPIGGLGMEYALEEIDILSGTYELNSTYLNTQIGTMMNMNFNQVKVLNDLLILQ